MTTDNRTNEPKQNEAKLGKAFCFTDAQVEAAAKAIYGDDPAWGYVNDYGGGEVASQEMFRLKARAALVAAQGAAPQAESAPKSSYISPSLPGMIRNLWKSDPSENSVRTALKLAGDLIQELIDLRASTVLPSSGVDEIAEVIRHAMNNGYREWPEGIARAVVEAIGGESR